MTILLYLFHQEESGALQLFTAETIKSVLRTERNQQMMCDVRLMSAILSTCRQCLEDEASPLHSPFQVGCMLLRDLPLFLVSSGAAGSSETTT